MNHNEFLYSKLRAKMTAVNPNVLIQATSEHQRHLDSKEDFCTYVQQAIQIAHLMHVHSPKRKPKREPKPLAQGPFLKKEQAS